MTRIKICGLRRPQDIEAVNRAGHTEVLHLRLYFLFGGGNGGVHKLADTVVFGGAYRDDRYAD